RWRGSIFDQPIEELLNSHVMAGTGAENGNQRSCGNGLLDRAGELTLRDFPLFEIPLHKLFVRFDCRVDDLLVGFLRIDDAAVRDTVRNVDRADDAAECFAQTDRHIDESARGAE